MSIFKNRRKRFTDGMQKVVTARNEWGNFEYWAMDLLNWYVNNSQDDYEKLYVITNRDVSGTRTNNDAFIQFYAGSHPTGVTRTVRNPTTGHESVQHVVEDSGCLLISQDPKGGVFFVVYPSKSEVLKWNDEFLILKYRSSPAKVMWSDLRNAIEFYLSYALYTSTFSDPTVWERIQLWWMKFKIRSIVMPIMKFLGHSAKIYTALHTGLPIK